MSDDAPVLHAGIGGATKCKSCEATIIFAKTLTGMSVPFERDGHGVWTIENGNAHLATSSSTARYTSHTTKCSGRPRG